MATHARGFICSGSIDFRRNPAKGLNVFSLYPHRRTRHGEVSCHPLNCCAVHWVDLSAWHRLQELGILY